MGNDSGSQFFRIMGEGKEEGAVKGESPVCAGKNKTDDMDADRESGAVAEEIKSAGVELVPPYFGGWAGRIVRFLEKENFPPVLGGNFFLEI